MTRYFTVILDPTIWDCGSIKEGFIDIHNSEDASHEDISKFIRECILKIYKPHTEVELFMFFEVDENKNPIQQSTKKDNPAVSLSH
jgi:hypothetical protein